MKSEFLLSEAIVDAWATILHTCVVGYRASRDYETYCRASRLLLEYEVFHAVRQCAVFLRHVESDYGSLRRPDLGGAGDVYAEQTNGLCYYVLRACILNARDALARDWTLPYARDTGRVVEFVVRAFDRAHALVRRVDEFVETTDDASRTICGAN